MEDVESFQRFFQEEPSVDPPLPEWYAKVDHERLCRSDHGDECRFRRALAAFHWSRVGGKMRPPEVFDLEQSGDAWEAWEAFVEYWERQPQRGQTPSPRKRKASSSDAVVPSKALKFMRGPS